MLERQYHPTYPLNRSVFQIKLTQRIMRPTADANPPSSLKETFPPCCRNVMVFSKMYSTSTATRRATGEVARD